ncbi:MAG TPA: hypothetical protein PKX40_05415 [Spirochaetota bacterium]|nr:hypothetical protein [Spirochaetota bacterium]
MDQGADIKAIRNFYILFNVLTEGLSFFVVVPIVLFYVWTNIQLTPEQLETFNKIWPPFFVFGLAFVMVNNWIVLIPVLKYFKKLRKGQEVSDEEYIKAKKRFFRLPAIHAVGALFRWLLLLSLPILVINIMVDLTVPQAVNMWLGPPLCSLLGIMSYFTITELFIQRIINRGVFARKTSEDLSPRLDQAQPGRQVFAGFPGGVRPENQRRPVAPAEPGPAPHGPLRFCRAPAGLPALHVHVHNRGNQQDRHHSPVRAGRRHNRNFDYFRALHPDPA